VIGMTPAKLRRTTSKSTRTSLSAWHPSTGDRHMEVKFVNEIREMIWVLGVIVQSGGQV